MSSKRQEVTLMNRFTEKADIRLSTNSSEDLPREYYCPVFLSHLENATQIEKVVFFSICWLINLNMHSEPVKHYIQMYEA